MIYYHRCHKDVISFENKTHLDYIFFKTKTTEINT